MTSTLRSTMTAALFAVPFVIAACSQPEPPPAPAPAEPEISAARGEYLVSITGCHDCHTPFKMGPMGPEPDMTRMLSGHPEGVKMPPAPKWTPTDLWAWHGAITNTAFAGPWGVSYTMNLTPDENTGIGIWTEEMFVDAIREGKHMGTARPILPPMPWPVYRNMTDSDLKSVYAYLRTIPKISNRIPEPIIAPPPPGAAN